jgi:ElaB/YqjD/DUF883 family membrane-anchored ribosome-binding protein
VLNKLAAPTASASKSERTFAMVSACNQLATSAHTIAASLEATLTGIPALNTSPEKPLTVEQAKELLRREIEIESKVEQALERLNATARYLDKQVLRGALREYQSSTGLLDDHPRLSAAVCATLGVATLAAGIYGAIVTHGATHHITETIVGAVFGHGMLGAAASVFAVPVSLFIVGIPVLGSSVLGPIAFGALKVLGGNIVRALSAKAQERFAQERDDAGILGATLRSSCESILEDVRRIQPLYASFMDRNQTLRAMAGTALNEVPTEHQDRATVDELRTLNASLGIKEFSSGIRLLTLERTLRNAQETEFRSPELRETSQGEYSAPALPLFAKVYRAFSLTANAISNFASRSQLVGTQTALNAAEDLHDTCDHMPSGALDPISATGSSLGTTLHIALETGVQPEKAFLDAVKGIVGLVKSSVAGGKPEGPSGASLVRVLLELEEIERGNRVRWLVKLGPSLAFALLKKPALVLKAQKLEEATGKVSPEMFESDYAKSKGRFYSAVKSSKEIARLMLGLVREGGYRWLVELPLTHAKESGFPLGYLRNNSYTKATAERIISLSGNFLVAQEQKHREKLQQQLESCLTRVPNADAVRGMDGEALTKYAIRKFIDYRYNANAEVDGDEITAILRYWKLKETAAWYTDKHRTRIYRGELEALHPDLGTLHDTLHGSSNLWTIMSDALDVATAIGSKLKNPSAQVKTDAEKNERKALADFLQLWNHDASLLPQPHDTIIDCGKGGTPLVLLTRIGTLELLEGAEGRKRLLSSSSAFTIPPHADHARIAAAELLLATTLENYQREAVLAAHAKLVADPGCRNDVIQDLLGKSFTSAQLLGGPPAEDGRRLGLLSLGIVGA